MINLKKQAISIEFKTLSEAISYAKSWGGWIFLSNDEKITQWYDASHYTLSAVLKRTPGAGKISAWSTFEEEATN